MRRAARVVFAALLVSGVFGTPRADAAAITYECRVAGTLTIVGTEPAEWSLAGAGRCVDGTPAGAWNAEVTGIGGSDNLGLCSGDPVLQNLELSVRTTLTESGALVPRTKLLSLVWIAANTTYPGVTSFGVREVNGPATGEGILSHHLFLDCQGSPAFHATFTFTK